MPNHVTTILTIEDLGALELADVRSLFVNKNDQVDLNLVLPMPECLRGFEPHGGITTRAEMALGLMSEPGDGYDIGSLTARLHIGNAMREAAKPIDINDIGSIIRAIENYKKCGFMYWYDWASDNWETKWNAYGQPEAGYPEDAKEFEFQTAWSHPSKMIKRLSEKADGVTFSVKFADEDIGSNCGAYRIKSGCSSQEDIAPRWDEQTEVEKRKFTEFAFHLLHRNEDPGAYGYDRNWEYSEAVLNQYESFINA